MARSSRGLLAALLFILAATATARATPLAPGGTVSGTAPGNVISTYSGNVVAFTPIANSEFQGVFQGVPTVGYISSAVVRTATAGLDFVYQVNVSIGKVTGLSISSFGNFTTDVVQTAGHSGLTGTNQFTTGSVPVETYTRSTATGNAIDVTFSGGGVTGGNGSYLVIVHTNSTTYAHSSLNIAFNGPFLSVPTLAPVPEPGTMLLWAGSFGGAVGFFGRRWLRSVTANA